VTQESKPSQEFVTFNTIVSPQGLPLLTLWFHTPEPVTLPQQLQARPGLIENNNPPVTFNTSAGSSPSSLWDLTLQGNTPLQDKEFLTFNFNADDILVGPAHATLTSVIQNQHLEFVGYDGNHTIQAFYEVNMPQPVSQNRPPLLFVTITPDPPSTTPQRGLELWFHLNLAPQRNVIIMQELAFEVFAEVDANATIPVKATIQGQPHRNVFNIQLDNIDWERARFSQYLRFVFLVNKSTVKLSPGAPLTTPLRTYIEDNGINFEGYNGTDSIIVYVRVPNTLHIG